MRMRTGSWWLICSGLLFGFYSLNVILGKLTLGANQERLIPNGDVGEFLVLFAAVICLVITMLRREE